MSAAPEVRWPGWYRFAGPIERYWDGADWTGDYRRRRREVSAGAPTAADIELAVAEPIDQPEPEPLPVVDEDDALNADEPEPAAEEDHLDAPSPAPRTRRRLGGRRTQRAHAAPYCPHIAANPIGEDMAGQAAQLVIALIAAMGYDANEVTAIHIAATDAGLEAAVTVQEKGAQHGSFNAPKRTDIVHLGS